MRLVWVTDADCPGRVGGVVFRAACHTRLLTRSSDCLDAPPKRVARIRLVRLGPPPPAVFVEVREQPVVDDRAVRLGAARAGSPSRPPSVRGLGSSFWAGTSPRAVPGDTSVKSACSTVTDGSGLVS